MPCVLQWNSFALIGLMVVHAKSANYSSQELVQI